MVLDELFDVFETAHEDVAIIRRGTAIQVAPRRERSARKAEVVARPHDPFEVVGMVLIAKHVSKVKADIPADRAAPPPPPTFNQNI